MSCQGAETTPEQAACLQCIKICSSKEAQHDIAVWAMRLSLTSYARTLSRDGPQAHSSAQLALRESDWYKVDAKCKVEADNILNIEDAGFQIQIIRKKLLSIPFRVRSEQLNAWLQASVQTLEVPCESASEREALSALTRTFSHGVATGSIQRADLAIAAKVASGGLQASRVVNCLIASFFDMRAAWLGIAHCCMMSVLLFILAHQCSLPPVPAPSGASCNPAAQEREGRSRRTTSRHLDMDTVEELLFCLGQSTAARSVLSLALPHHRFCRAVF